ncbi:PaaI family thioesterase [Alkalilacustris brevis]|uniref:PaaI family thioesterase n=1 Tax=Alkalilacustris brevis TaxID=2026338 RepID=UPI000E0DAC07|nr:PaaI family thioesterase [Alkalilacustris brevis]
MEQELEKAGWRLEADDGFVGHVGGLWRREVSGQTQIAFVARALHANRNRVVHGGMLMTFMDRALGQTARLATGAVRGATVSLTHQFLAPVRIGDLVEVTPQITKATSRMVFMTGTAFVGDVPVVSAQGVWRVSHSPR